MSDDFLTENAKKPGWKTTASGLQYHVDKAVPGAPKPAAGSVVTVNYEGTLTDGKAFTADLERAYQEMWTAALSSPPGSAAP